MAYRSVTSSHVADHDADPCLMICLVHNFLSFQVKCADKYVVASSPFFGVQGCTSHRGQSCCHPSCCFAVPMHFVLSLAWKF